ncbi:hypothetical protein PDJAM_G00078640 [Pangasius djambal]|uniref:Uncharacterized protein n=1 Tax=Pangasius djambal TaxID=1691987 RepID=A0ACC5Z2C8_9TELE|nr:hypothetical protein [Pangasius djambal]
MSTLWFHIRQQELPPPFVWVQLCCAFRYGNEDLDVIGLIFRKDIWINHIQLYPDAGHKPQLTDMHNTLLKKAGEQAYAFTFNIPNNLPCSITLQPGPEDQGKKPCGVDFEVKAYVAKQAEDPNEKVDKKDTCRLIIRKSQYAPVNTGTGQRAELFEQTTDVILYSADKYTKCVLNEEFAETVEANSAFEKVFRITPLLAQNREKRGLSVDGKLKYEDTNLASTTLMRPGMDKEILGILVCYKITVHLLVSGGGLLGGLTGSGFAADSDAPQTHSVSEVLRSDHRYLVLFPHTTTWRKHEALSHRKYRSREVPKYHRTRVP